MSEFGWIESAPFAKEALFHACDRLFRLRERLHDLSTKAYITDAPLILTQLLDDLAVHIGQKLSAAGRDLERAVEPGDASNAENSIRLLGSFISSLYRWIDVLELSRPDHVPHRLVPALERLAHTISWTGATIISPLSDINHSGQADTYSYLDVYDDLFGMTDRQAGLSSVLELGKDFFTKYPPHFTALFFPAGAKDDVLQHVIFGHELGHFADRVYGFSHIPDKKIDRRLRRRLRTALRSAVRGFLRFVVTSIGEENIRSTFPPYGDYEGLQTGIEGRLDEEIQRCNEDWLRELAADVFSVRLFGPAAFLSIATHLVTTGRARKLADMALPGLDHPPPAIRLSVMMREIDALEREGTLQGLPTALKDALGHWRIGLEHALRLSPPPPKLRFLLDWQSLKPSLGQVAHIVNRVYWQAQADGLLDQICAYMSEQMLQARQDDPWRQPFMSRTDTELVSHAVSLLNNGVVPCEVPCERRLRVEEGIGVCVELSEGLSVSTIVNAAWAQMLDAARDPAKSVLADDVTKTFRRRQREFGNLALAGIELADLIGRYHRRVRRRAGDGEVIVQSPITEHLLNPNLDRRLTVTPLLNPGEQICGGGIDLTLGTEFISTKKTRLSAVDSTDEDASREVEKYHETHYIPFGRSFVLHPGEFVLASTLEYLKMPPNLGATLVGRSSTGRLGLSFATGATAKPWYRGRLTLELLNVGALPIVLYPGMRIAELRIHEVDEIAAPEPSKYDLSIGPELSRLNEDREISVLCSPAAQVIVALVGPMGAGKTEIARYLANRRGFVKYSLAGVVLDEAKRDGLPETVKSMRSVGNDRRSQNPSCFADLVVSIIRRESAAPRVVVDSVRNPSEIEALERFRPVFLLGVTGEEDTRFRRERRERGRCHPCTSREEFARWDAQDLGQGQPDYGQQIRKLLEMAGQRALNGSGAVLDTTNIGPTQLNELYRMVDKVLDHVSAMAVHAHI